MLFANRDYVAPAVHRRCPGFVLLGAAAVLLAVGAFVMSKLAKVEV